MRKVVIGIFNDYASATQALESLRGAGFSPKNISLIGQDPNEMRPLASSLTSAGEPDRVVTGFGIAGAIGGFLVGLGTIAIPGTGALLVAGPILAALSGAAAGSMLGVVAGAVVHFDVPESEAHVYQGHVEAGKVLIAVHSDDQEERFRAERIMDQFGAIEVDTKAA